MLLRIAQSAGLSEAQFNACEQNEAALKALANRVQRAEDVDHVESTPTFFINGKMVHGKAGLEMDFDQLDQALKPLTG